MQSYEATWAINIDAEDEIEAARIAQGILTDPGTAATVFCIRPEGQEFPIHVIDVGAIKPEIIRVDRGGQ